MESVEQASCSGWRAGLSDPLVMKFGGTSVGSGAAFRRAAGTVAGEAAKQRPVAAVVSAMSGVTDTLLAYAEATARLDGTGQTATGSTLEGSLAELHRSLYERHLDAAREAVGPALLPGVERELLSVLESLLGSLTDEHPSEAARRAGVVVHGERLSAVVLAAAISTAGVPAEVAPDPIATDSAFSEAEVDVERTRARCAERVEPVLRRGSVAVVPGFVGRDRQELPTTLGRGGSDLSATVLGRGIGASEVWILTDVPGVLDADPRLVEGAGTLPEMSYREAHLFAGLGAKVLHHRTMEPAAAAGIEVSVKNSFAPGEWGTRISARECGRGVRCVAVRDGLSIGVLSAGERTAGKDVLCALGCDGGGLQVLREVGADGEVAAVVGIGAPTDADLVRGLASLAASGIEHLWAGSTALGLTFVVGSADARFALGALHGALVGRTESGVESEVPA
ncbi:aspartate kinase [Rubrobacter radiotolerans]|nr:aspartate kinase [Rubrobacter radiotolerans]MDX5893738.1 aspartate kinase [Rubrobacter radiotolerans]